MGFLFVRKSKKWYGAQFSTQTEINTFPLLPDSRTDDSCEVEEDDENKNNIKIRYQKIRTLNGTF